MPIAPRAAPQEITHEARRVALYAAVAGHGIADTDDTPTGDDIGAGSNRIPNQRGARPFDPDRPPTPAERDDEEMDRKGR